jgi:hypothetical protein
MLHLATTIFSFILHVCFSGSHPISKENIDLCHLKFMLWKLRFTSKFMVIHIKFVQQITEKISTENYQLNTLFLNFLFLEKFFCRTFYDEDYYINSLYLSNVPHIKTLYHFCKCASVVIA